jgi:hypothetical protein
MAKQTNYSNPFGMWKVTTEGDVEGKTTRDLGTHEGNLDDIAFMLGGKVGYTLEFRRVYPEKQLGETPPVSKVHVSLADAGLASLPPAERAKYFSDMLIDRPCIVSEGQYYDSVVLTMPEERRKAAELQKALSKLEDSEIEVLREHFRGC